MPEPDESRSAAGPDAAPLQIPAILRRACDLAPERRAWLQALPASVRILARRWELRVGRVYAASSDGLCGSCAWVARVTTAGGRRAVLKLGMPHMEGEDEIAGLRVWNGEGAVRLLRWDEDLGAMLLERCVPGRPLRSQPPEVQDRVIAGLLPRLWHTPPREGFRSLASMIEHWTARAREEASETVDTGLLGEGIAALRALARGHGDDALLHTDLHAGNVLAAEREPWLAIDPKPFLGDPCYDATQHLLNGLPRLRKDPRGTVTRFADLLRVDASRVRLWTFGRLALGGIAPEQAEEAPAIASILAP